MSWSLWIKIESCIILICQMTMKLFIKHPLFFTAISMLGLCALFTACRSMNPKPSNPHNTLTAQEKADGWRLLWDGKTTDGWRSARSDYFPTNSWLIHDGEFSVVSSGNGE